MLPIFERFWPHLQSALFSILRPHTTLDMLFLLFILFKLTLTRLSGVPKQKCWVKRTRKTYKKEKDEEVLDS